MKNIIRAAALSWTLILITALTASPAFSATGMWTADRLHYTIYASGGTGETIHYQSTTYPVNSLITSTSVLVRPYTNGATTETIRICYQQYGTTNRTPCTSELLLTGATTYPLSTFNGLSPKGAITVRHTLTGGTYPAIPGGVQDTVTVNYSY